MFGLEWLSPKVVGVVLVALATAAVLGYVYHLGGNEPRAQLAALQASYKAAQDLHKADSDRKAGESKSFVDKLELQHAENIRSVAAGWAAFHADELRKQAAGSSGGKRPQPARVDAIVCNDPDKDRRLSDAFQSFRSEARGALDDCVAAARESRSSDGNLLESADTQAGELVLIKAWALGIKQINQ